MTKSRKIGIIVAFALLFALLATNIIPLTVVDNSNVADAVAVVPHAEWKNAYTGSYYNNLNTGKIGTAFRSELANLITTTHTRNTVYNGNSTYALNNVWPHSDKDMDNINANTMKWFYSGTVVSADSFGGSVGQTNREHVWAKNGGSTFEPEAGPGADAHHLRPTECQLNSTRSNWGFAEVTQSQSTIAKQNNRTDYGDFPDGLCYKSGSFFYPAAGYRGATARILMYMQVRYGDEFSLYFIDGASSSNGKGIGKISDLFKWHLQEPPTTEEIYRNHAIAEIQGNRNPFIDHPEYAEMIYCNDGQSYNSALKSAVAKYGSYLNGNGDPDKIPESISLSQTSLTLTAGSSSSKITVTAEPSTASNEVTWSSNNTSVATVSDGVVKAVNEGTAVITAKSIYDNSVTASLSVTVTPVQLTGLTISPSAIQLKKGSGKSLTVTPIPSNASAQVTWSSDAEDIATVNEYGYVTPLSAGTAHITATSVKFPNISVTATVTVIEAPTPSTIEVLGSPNKTVYSEGETFDPTGLSVMVTYNNGTTQIFSTQEELGDNFQWVDGVTGATTLSAGTTSIICKFGALQAAVSGITVVDPTEGFLLKMAIIESDDYDELTLQQKFEAISQAIEAYNALSASDQQKVQGKYATLLAAARDYNELASGNNATLSEAVTLAANVLVKTLKSLTTLLKTLINVIFWR